MIKNSLIILACALPSVSFGGWLGPSNYDECVLESMKGVTSDVAARAIIRSCRERFQERKADDAEIPASAIGQLDGRAGMTDYGYFKGRIYNGNSDWTITQITIMLVPKAKDKDKPHPADRAREYNVDLSVPPLTNSDFSVSADGGGSTDFHWSITKARGRKPR